MFSSKFTYTKTASVVGWKKKTTNKKEMKPAAKANNPKV